MEDTNGLAKYLCMLNEILFKKGSISSNDFDRLTYALDGIEWDPAELELARKIYPAQLK